MSDFKFKEGDIVLCVLPEESFEAKIISRNYIMDDGETPTYQVQAIKNGTKITISEDRMMYSPNYAVSYIASAPEELKVGDRVEVIDKGLTFFGQIGKIVAVVDDDVHVEFKYDVVARFRKNDLRQLPDKISFEEGFVSARSEKDSDNVKAFKAILNEMAETYKAKDATYGNAYQDGFNRFGAVQLVSRMYEKYCRIENLLVRNADNKVPDESIIDTITDLGVQCVVLRMLMQKNDFENVD